MLDGNQSSLAQQLFHSIIQMKRLGFQKMSVQPIRQSEMMLLVTLFHVTSPDFIGVKISDLSSKLQITPAAVTHMINVLVKEDYVERSDDPKDRRIVLIKPTSKGIDLVKKMEQVFVKKCTELIDFLGEKKSKELIKLLSIAANFFKEN